MKKEDTPFDHQLRAAGFRDRKHFCDETGLHMQTVRAYSRNGTAPLVAYIIDIHVMYRAAALKDKRYIKKLEKERIPLLKGRIKKLEGQRDE